MLVPLYVLAVGALLAGLVFKHFFIGEGAGEFWKTALFYSDRNHILETMEQVPFLVSMLPTLFMLIGAFVALYLYVLAPGTAESWANVNRPLYNFLLNKWYFDELYDRIFVRPAFFIGRLFWKGGDGFIIDGFGPDGVAAAVVGTTRSGRQAADRLRLPLRIRHDARGRGLHHLVSGRGRALMWGFGILSGLVFLPILGSVLILAIRGDDEATRRNIRWIALITTLVVFGLSLVAWSRFNPARVRVPAPREQGLVRRRARLSHGRRRHLDAIRRAHGLPHAVLHPGLLGVDPGPGAGVHDLLPGVWKP